MQINRVNYDSTVIEEFAGRLYRQANSIIISSALVSAVIGGAVALVVAIAFKDAANAGMLALVGAFVGGIIGLARGRERAFKLKLDAQVALCQVQIEKNTASK